MIKYRVFLGLVGAVVCVVQGALAWANSPVYGGSMRIAINSDIRSTNPGVRRDGNTDMVLYHVAEALVAYTDDLKVAPMLAESIIKSDKGTAYHFKLRKGVTFHNGQKMTSQEVIWSWNRLLAKKTGYRCRTDFNGEGPTGLKIIRIEAKGPYDVVFHLNQPSSLFLHRMADIQCLTAILHPSSLARDGTWHKPVATGPYRIKKWQKGQYISLTRFEDYAARTDAKNGLAGRKVAYFDELVFQIVPDRISAKAAVYAGNTDLVFALPLSAAKEVSRREKKQKDIRLFHQNTLDWTTLLIQTRDPLFADVRMRRALAHAVSQDLVATFAAFGYAKGNPTAVPASSPYFSQTPKIWPEYDPDKARKLAEEAGYDGQTLIIQTNRKYSYMFDNAVAIQAMLTAAGFNVKLEIYDWATQLTNFFKGNFQLSAFGYSARSHPALVYGNIIGDKSIRATAQWDSEHAFDLVSRLETAQNEPEIQSIINQLHLVMVQELPIIGLYNDHIIDIAKSDIRGYRPWAFGRPRLWGVWRKKAEADE